MLKEIARSAAVAWSPSRRFPGLLAAGTIAGTMSLDFDPTGSLEIISLDLNKSGSEMRVLGRAPTAERLHKLAWSSHGVESPGSSHKHGLIAGGMASGAITVWNPTPLIENTGENPLLATVQNHTGSVYGLDFNPFQSHLLASGGANNEVYIWDLQHSSKPTAYTPGTPSTSGASMMNNDITSVAWNRKVIHILATSTSSGATVIWDLRAKRPVMSFGGKTATGSRNSCKIIAWNPEQPTSIATASDDDDAPVIQMWNLVNTYAPERNLAGKSGHTAGVLSLSWGSENFLLSTGKDRRTLLWDLAASSDSNNDLIAEVETSANWNFDVQWSPSLPAVASTCSLDGHIRILRLTDFDTRPALPPVGGVSQGPTMSQQSLNDLFGLDVASPSAAAAPAAQSPPSTGAPSVPPARDDRPHGKAPARAPTWLRRPAGATFGFGGKLVMFGLNKAATASPSPVGPPTPAAGKTPTPSPAGSSVAAAKILLPSPVTIVTVTTETELIRRADLLEKALQSGKLAEFCESKLRGKTATGSSSEEERATWSFIRASCAAPRARQELLVHLGFEPETVSNTLNDFIATLPLPQGISKGLDDDDEEDEDDEAQEDDEKKKKLAGKMEQDSAVLPPVVDLISKDSTETMLTRALIVGDFTSAVDCCIRLDRMADALVLAACGGGKLWTRTQEIYFKLHAKTKPFVAIISSIVNKNMKDLVDRVDLARWRECLAILCTYAVKEEFGPLCTRLGDRLRSAGAAHSATLCYISAGAFEQTFHSWLGSNSNSTKKMSTEKLQDMIERVVIFSSSTTGTGKKNYVSPLASIDGPLIAEYAELLASQGRLNAALHYLREAAVGDSPKVAELYDRVFHAIHKRGTTPAQETPPFPFQPIQVGGPSHYQQPRNHGQSQAQTQSARLGLSEKPTTRSTLVPQVMPSPQPPSTVGPVPSMMATTFVPSASQQAMPPLPVPLPTPSPSAASSGSKKRASAMPPALSVQPPSIMPMPTAPVMMMTPSPMLPPTPTSTMVPPPTSTMVPPPTSTNTKRASARAAMAPSVGVPPSPSPSPSGMSTFVPAPQVMAPPTMVMPPSPLTPMGAPPATATTTPSPLPPPPTGGASSTRNKARASVVPTTTTTTMVPSTPLTTAFVPTLAPPPTAVPPPTTTTTTATVAPPPPKKSETGAAVEQSPQPPKKVIKKKSTMATSSDGVAPPPTTSADGLPSTSPTPTKKKVVKKKKTTPSTTPRGEMTSPVESPSATPPPPARAKSPAAVPPATATLVPPPAMLVPSPSTFQPTPLAPPTTTTTTKQQVATAAAPAPPNKVVELVLATEHEAALSELRAIISKLVQRGENLGDIDSRISDLSEKMRTLPQLGVTAPAFLAVAKFSSSLNGEGDGSKYSQAREAQAELTNQHYHILGSKAMLGLKRLLAAAEKHQL